jgi:hypothetical protein
MKTDLSSAAITKRLKQTSELRRLCIALGGERLKKRLRKEFPFAAETPNATTRETFEATDRGEDLDTYESLDETLEALDK